MKKECLNSIIKINEINKRNKYYQDRIETALETKDCGASGFLQRIDSI